MSQAAAASMSHASRKLVPLSAPEQLRVAREIIRLEAVALWKLSNRLGDSFSKAVSLIHRTTTETNGSVIVTGMGKAGIIGKKIAATLASTGTRSHFMHPAEAFHGDLGRVGPEDVVLMLTQSGETGEVTQLLPSVKTLGAALVAITAQASSTVGQAADHVIELGELEEACSLGLAPSTSTTAMVAVGDALALVLSKMLGFGAEDFAKFHPGGSLGRKLSSVDEVMRSLDECRVAMQSQSTREVLVACSKPGRRPGAVMLVDEAGKLTGLFTDSDLARLFERHDEASLDLPIHERMMAEPTTITAGEKMSAAVELLAQRKISELPVVDDQGKPVGMIDVTDIVGWVPPTNSTESSTETPSVRLYPGEAVHLDEDTPAAG